MGHAPQLGEVAQAGEVPAGKGQSGLERLRGRGFTARLGERDGLKGSTGSEVGQAGQAFPLTFSSY